MAFVGGTITGPRPCPGSHFSLTVINLYYQSLPAKGVPQSTDADNEIPTTKRPELRNPYRPRTSQKHIHPCVCDLKPDVRRRIRDRQQRLQEARQRYYDRLDAFDAEIRAREAERLRLEQEEREMEALYKDRYTTVRRRRVRKRRDARRASMVSLGVKTVINWRKKVTINENRTSELRKKYACMCGDHPIPLPTIKRISIVSPPKLPVRLTRTLSLRAEVNQKRLLAALGKIRAEKERAKPPFVVPTLPTYLNLPGTC